MRTWTKFHLPVNLVNDNTCTRVGKLRKCNVMNQINISRPWGVTPLGNALPCDNPVLCMHLTITGKHTSSYECGTPNAGTTLIQRISAYNRKDMLSRQCPYDCFQFVSYN